MDPAELKYAFTRFEHASEQLSHFYRGLEDRVETLSAELVAARAETREQLDAANRLTERLSRLLELLPAGVLVLAGDGSLEEFNPVAEALLGPLTAGEPWREVVARAFAPQPDDGHDITLTSGRRVHLETTALTAPGGRSDGQILLLTDVTRTRALQDQLARSRRASAKTEMAAALAHQIRTPLATALLYAGHLKAVRDPRAEACGAPLMEALRGLEGLVEDMLKFARGEALDTEIVPLSRLLERLAVETGNFCEQTGFVTRVTLPGPEAEVDVNLDTLVNVCMNLVKNAFEVAGAQGEGVDFAIEAAAGTWVTLSFTDRGPGIPDDARERIFEPFFSAGKQGSGLGLPVARSVVRSLGGELTLDERHTEGARFLVHLPRAAAATGEG